tara:strand:+ start:297 stop:701 length:405 start_codon:yes stop_codon:yes gene_type:complete
MISDTDSVEKEASIQRDLVELEKIRALAISLDRKFTLPGGIPIGVDAIVGFIPIVGDVSSAALSFWLLLRARKLKVSTFTQARMVGHIAVDSMIGSIPIVGDIFDIVYQANMRNLRLVERALEKRIQRTSKGAR